MLRFGRTLVVISIFVASAQAEQIKLSDPWKGQEIIETDDFIIDELDQIRASQQDEDVEKQIREALLERASMEPLLLRGDPEEQ